ncbi:MAG TPA: hypothetical protein VFP22_03480 [Candidatus Limnocylindrales bacterium]|nr:hypothetical protein [Candidatus Limnocylindrales bacterium]
MRRISRLAAGFVLVASLLTPTASASPPLCRDHRCPPPGPVGMARLFTSGAETADLTTEGLTIGAGTPTIDTGQVRSGSRSFKFNAGAGNAIQALTLSLTGTVVGRAYFARAYFYYTAAPSADTRVFGFLSQISVYVKTTGVLVVRMANAGTVDKGATSAALVANTWYRLEIMQQMRSGSADDDWEFRLDGATVSSATGETLGTVAPTGIGYGYGTNAPGANYVMYLDDIALNDDQGASQNTWPGDGKVVLLSPTALSAGGTGWTDDQAASTAAALLAAVDNTPPNGIADTTAGGGNHQDRNATSNASSNLDMTMTTYSAAGIGVGDTINVIDPIVATAAPVSTSAKAGTVGVVSNPAIANVSLGAGGTSGAFWSGTAAGTYPTGWKISHGTTTYAPSVTVGTAPVMRVTQVTSSTRIAMVCFMGMYVDYTPLVAAFIPPSNQMAQLLAG